MGAGLDEQVREHLARGEHDEAVTLVVETLGGKVLGYLCSLLDEDDAHDAFSIFEENVWRGLPSWRGEGSSRAWAYGVARNAARQVSRETYRRRRERLRSSAASRIPAPAATSSGYAHGSRRDRLLRLRAALSADDLSLFILRLDRDLGWDEVGTVLGISAVAARKRYQRIKEKLERMARRRGLIG